MSKLMMKAASGLLAVGLVFTGLSPAFAASNLDLVQDPGTQSVQASALPQTAVSLEQAIGIAKEYFPVPADLDQFVSSFQENNGKKIWSLVWQSTGNDGSNLNVQVDADNGQILSMNRWNGLVSGGTGSSYLPKYTRDQALPFATALAGKLEPVRFKTTKLSAEQNILRPLIKVGNPTSYHYNFQRLVNGIVFPENSINLDVDANTGEVTSYNLVWDDSISFPGGEPISQGAAEKIFKDKMAPQLIYFQPWTANQGNAPMKLAYQVSDPGRFYINALTGEVIEQSSFFPGGKGGDMKTMSPTANSASQGLTPVEQSEVDQNKNLLSKDKALAVAKEAVTVPADYKLQDATLFQDQRCPGLRLWSFTWNNNNGSMLVSVNAETGELLSFNRYNNQQNNNNDPAKEDIKSAQAKAEAFITQLQPQKFSQVKLKDSWPDLGYLIDGSQQPRAFEFNYSRLVNNIPFPDNGFNVVVDAVTGDVTGYQMNWWTESFPAPSGVISQDQASDQVLANNGLELAYQRLDQSGQESILPIYRLQQDAPALLDAATGQPMDNQGQIISQGSNVKITDIAGHWAASDINLLAASGIIQCPAGLFHPDDKITGAELAEWLNRAGVANENAAGQVKGAAQVSRQELARLLVNALGYGKVAGLSGIYMVGCTDAGSIDQNYVGAVAIARGLKLMSDTNGYFYPAETVTKAQAATALVRMLKFVS